MKKTFWSRISDQSRCTIVASRVALIFLHAAVLILVTVSMIEVITVIEGSIHDLEKGNKVMLIGVLVAASVPSGAVIFWGCNAIKVVLDLPIRRVYRRCRNQGEN